MRRRRSCSDAVSGVGRSANGTCVSPVFYPEWHQSAPASVISAPKWNENSYVAGGFPTIKVMENHPTNPVGPTDANTTDRLFVGRLLNRCKLDSATSTISQALVPSDTNYSSLALPIPANSPPAFTQVFVPVGITPGTYELVPYSQPPTPRKRWESLRLEIFLSPMIPYLPLSEDNRALFKFDIGRIEGNRCVNFYICAVGVSSNNG